MTGCSLAAALQAVTCFHLPRRRTGAAVCAGAQFMRATGSGRRVERDAVTHDYFRSKREALDALVQSATPQLPGEHVLDASKARARAAREVADDLRPCCRRGTIAAVAGCAPLVARHAIHVALLCHARSARASRIAGWAVRAYRNIGCAASLDRRAPRSSLRSDPFTIGTRRRLRRAISRALRTNRSPDSKRQNLEARAGSSPRVRRALRCGRARRSMIGRAPPSAPNRSATNFTRREPAMNSTPLKKDRSGCRAPRSDVPVRRPLAGSTAGAAPMMPSRRSEVRALLALLPPVRSAKRRTPANLFSHDTTHVRLQALAPRRVTPLGGAPAEHRGAPTPAGPGSPLRSPRLAPMHGRGG